MGPAFGPPIPGAPWVAQPMPLDSPVPIAPPQNPLKADPTKTIFGPPIPGAPLTVLSQFFALRQTPPAPPSPLKGTALAPFIRRDPDASPRVRGFSEKVSDMLNSLMGQGYIKQTGPKKYVLADAGNFVTTRAPGLFDDSSIGAVPGSRWIDTVAAKFYICISSAVGGAVWNGPY